MINKLKHLSAYYKNIKQQGKCKCLPGTPYSQYYLPLDYEPSRNLKPRWGYSTKRIDYLEQYFIKYSDQYEDFLTYMQSMDVSHIPIGLENNKPLVPAWIGGPISPFDTLSLYAMISKLKPQKYVEIGSGMTTCFAHQAKVDFDLDMKLISIDPYPRREINDICDIIYRDGLENFDLKIFSELNSGDIVFFDGSHRSFMNSDVKVFFLDVLPMLKPGVMVHIHDIHLPWDYPEFFQNWYWNEQYLLAIYLHMGQEKINPYFPTRWVTHELLPKHSLRRHFPDLGNLHQNENWMHGGSMWFYHKN